MNPSLIKLALTLALASTPHLAKAAISDTANCLEASAAKATVRQKISRALCWAKQDYFRKANSILSSINTKSIKNTPQKDKLGLSKIIVSYHHYKYYKQKKNTAKKTRIFKKFVVRVNNFVSNSHTKKLTHYALSIGARVYFSEGKYSEAKSFWNALLNKNPSPNLFHEAVAGVIKSENRLGRHAHVIAALKQFLLRNKNKLPPTRLASLNQELAKSVLEYSTVLAKQGKEQEASRVLADIETTFPSIALREKMQLQQVYYHGKTQNWDKAITLCNAIIADTKASPESHANAFYLKARALEYKLELQKSAQAFLTFAKAYPQHQRAVFSARQAARLFSAEGQYKKGAISALLAASLNRNNAKDFLTAAESLSAIEDFPSVLALDAKIDPNSFDIKDKSRYHLIMAKAQYSAQKNGKAIIHLEQIANLSQSTNPALQRYGAEANLILGDIYAIEFTKPKLNGSIADVRTGFGLKAKIYEQKVNKHYQHAINSKINGIRTKAAQRLAKISLNFTQEIEYAANFLTADQDLRNKMRNYGQTLAKLTPLYFKEQNKLGLNIKIPQANLSQRKTNKKTPKKKGSFKKIEFFKDKSLGSY